MDAWLLLAIALVVGVGGPILYAWKDGLLDRPKPPEE
jgi:hypothetical protein